MSGAVMTMSLFGVAPPTPSAFSASAVDLDSKPALFQTAANAWPILMSPTLTAKLVMPASLKNVLRDRFIRLYVYPSQIGLCKIRWGILCANRMTVNTELIDLYN